MLASFPAPRAVLPNRALTIDDYRKLIIDLAGVKNAWLRPVDMIFFADPITATLSREQSEVVDRLSEVMNGDPRARLFALAGERAGRS